jgi:DNA-binding transcriptional ArsR family regulator
MTTDGVRERNLVKALGHPLRLRLLVAVIDGGEESPVRLARRFELPLATVSRHMRMLRDLGFIEQTRTEPRRGAVEHFYRAVEVAFIDDAEWAQLPVAMRRGLARQTFRKIFHEASAAGGSGGFDTPEAYLARVVLETDEAGRREISHAIQEVLRRVKTIQQRSDARRASDAGPTGPVDRTELALLHFHPVNTGGDAPGPSYR